MDSPRNPFEIFFLEAVSNPAKEGEFYRWVARQTFVVPCQGGGPTPTLRSRKVDLDASTRIRLRAFLQSDQTIVPFFSEQVRFEEWSLPDPLSQYVEISGRMFFGLMPKDAAALLNPNSDRFSKWFEPTEVSKVLSADP